jgi:Tfp pilus assembly major pilin PilA
MALEDYMEPEVAIAVAVTAAVASPQVRKTIRRGAVYGLAGLMIAGEKLSQVSQAIAQKSRQGAAVVQEAVSTRSDQALNEPASAAAG